MLKVTNLNVTKFSENALLLALDEAGEGSDLSILIEAELERRSHIEEDLLRRRHASQIESLKLTQSIQLEMENIFSKMKGTKTLFLIENLGQEFIENYTVDEETFTVYSKVSHSTFNNPSTWEFDSMEKAQRKMAQLIYYRIYDKFMRDATTDNLELLKRITSGNVFGRNYSTLGN